MKFIFILCVLLGSVFAIADWQDQNNKQTITVEVEGQKVDVVIDNETALELAGFNNDPFYECRQVPGGWRRCRKNSNRCYGSVFKHKFWCEETLADDGDDD